MISPSVIIKRITLGLRIVVGIAVILWLSSLYSGFTLNKHREACESESAVGVSPIQWAKTLATCMERRSFFPEKLYIGTTLKMLKSLPNAPCDFVGVWTSTRPGSAYRITLGDQGQFVSVPMADSGSRSVEESFLELKHDGGLSFGNWGVWNNKMAWFYNNLFMWPPDANPIIEKDGDRFTLIELNGVRTQFTRLGPIESSTCGTSGVSYAEIVAAYTSISGSTRTSKSNFVQQETGELPDLSKVLPKRAIAPEIASWAGEYTSSDSRKVKMTLSPSGQFSASLLCIPSSGPTPEQIKEEGNIIAEDEWYRIESMSQHAKPDCRIARRLYPVEKNNHRYLLSDEQLLQVVNDINTYRRFDPQQLLQTSINPAPGEKKTLFWNIDNPPDMPEPYRLGLQRKPLRGTLSSLSKVGATSSYELMGKKAEDVENGAGGSLNLGSSHGVMPGMIFHTTSGPTSLQIKVESVSLDQAKVRIIWKGTWRPTDGMEVSTAMPEEKKS